MKIVKKLYNSLDYWPNQLALLTFFVLLIITQTIAYRMFIVEKENEFLLVKEESNNTKNQLENAINYSNNAVKIINFLVEHDLEQENFETVAKDLLEKNKLIDALQLLKEKTNINTYPLKRNESTIGYDISCDQEHEKAAEEAVFHNRLFFEGPLKLIQGGTGIIGRQPIYKNDKLWGFSAVIIKRKTLLNAIGIDSSGTKNRFDYQLVGKNDKNNNHVLFKNKTDFKKGITYKSFIPAGEWYLYVKLKNPQHLNRASIFGFFGLVISVVIALFIRQLAEQPIKLRQLVALKTRDLENLNHTLNNRAKELTSTNKELEYFAYIISHDLQEPLRMISSFLSLIEKKYNDVLDEKGKRYIFFAVDGAKRMKNIILDILEFSKVGKYNEEPIELNVNDLVEEIVAYHRNAIVGKKVFVLYENLPTIYSFRSPIMQIFQNLISNAIKYAKQSDDVIITISQLEENDENWGFSVSDNGIGIDEKSLNNIF